MIREVFVVKNNSENDIELKDFGVIIPSGVTFELGEYDKCVMSDELYHYLTGGTLSRFVDGEEITELDFIFTRQVEYSGGTGIDISGYTISFSGESLAGNNITWSGETFNVKENVFLNLDQTIPQSVTGGSPQFDSIQFNLSAVTEHGVGNLHWDIENETLEFGMPGGSVILQIGQELLMKVVNTYGDDLFNGELVYITGVNQDGIPEIGLADATISPSILCMATEDIPDGETGYVATYGLVRDLNTNGFQSGTLLYLGINPGEFVDESPDSPYFSIPIGIIIKEGIDDGIILFQPKFGYKIGNLADVVTSGLTTTGQILTWYEDGQYFITEKNINDYLLISDFTGSTTLQDVTERGSTTDVQTTFHGGIITDEIISSGDTLKIGEYDDKSIISVNNISGFTGFNTTEPETLIHIFGNDTDNDSPTGLQTNALRIDGVVDADKDIQWVDNGVVKWLAEIYRGEKGKFWYLYNQEGDVTPLAISDTGRIGVNNPNNIINKYALSNINSGLNDIRFNGLYDKNFISIFQVEIDSVGTQDTFRWRVSYDEGHTFGSWISLVPVSTEETLLESGVYVYFLSETGHSLGNIWEKPVFPQLPPGTFTIHPNKFEEILLTDDYNAVTIDYNNYTSEFNSSREIDGVPILVSGDTIGALYVASTTKIDSVFFNIIEGGEDIILITEYWNGSNWIDISIGNPGYNDDTHNLTVSGAIEWDSSQLTNWIKSDIDDFEADNQYYWIRFRSTSNVTKQPLLNNIAMGGNKRFAVFSSPYDYKPAMYVDTKGRINIGGGSITRKNKLQINSKDFIDVVVGSGSLIEMDSDDYNASDLRIKLTSDDAYGTGIAIVKTRGELTDADGVQTGDELGHIWFRARVGSTGATLTSIVSEYTGDGDTNSIYGDLIFNTAAGSSPLPVERVRINYSGHTGFGVSDPNALIHLQSGSTTVAPFKFNSGSLLTSPQIGAIEFVNDNWYGTITTGTERKTFAFLESPQFIGTPNLPSGTTLNMMNLYDFIVTSGGSSSTSFVTLNDFNTYTGNTEITIGEIETDITELSGWTGTKLDTSVFNTYTGSTIPWDKIDFTDSDLGDLVIKNAEDVDINITSWDSLNVDDISTKMSKYLEDTQGTGRLEPELVLWGTNITTLTVSGGTGYINYPGFHKYITWNTEQFIVSGYTEGTYWVYVDSNGDIQISTSDPGSSTVIRLGIFYWGGTLIGIIQQCGCVIENSTSRLIDYVLRQGIFIYDGGGEVRTLTGNTLKILSSPCKIQYGVVDEQLTEVTSDDAQTFRYVHYYNSNDLGWRINYYFAYTSGLTITDRWNDTTKNSYVEYSGFTTTFTQGSNIVTSDENLTTFDLENAFIYDSSDGEIYMNPVSSVTWDGNETTILLESVYLGSGSNSILVADYALPKLLDGNFVKHEIIRSSDDRMYLILSQTYYNNEAEAKEGPLPSVPSQLVPSLIKMAYIVHEKNETDLIGKIYDIRPLPYQFREGGQTGGGSAVTNHSDLSGLGNDDHLQYLRTNGTRNLTGIQRYQSQPTFTTDLDVITKKYVDDADNLKLNITTFNTYTGTTVPNTYLSITNFNTYSGNTTTTLNTKIDRSGDTMIGSFTVIDGTTQVFKVDAVNDIVYFNTTGITNLVEADNLKLYGVGRIAFGDSVNIDRLRANAPGNVPRSLSLIDTNAVIRVWRWAGVGADPAVEFVWGTAETPADVNNNWWDMFLDGAASPNDTFVIRRRTGGTTVNKLIASDTQISIPMTTTSTSSTTGALIIAGGVGINENLNVNGTSNLTTLTVGTGLAKYLADYSGSYDTRTLVDKNYVDTLPLTYLSATSAGATTTTSTAYTLQTGMQITSVPVGTYLVGYGNWMRHNSANGEITTQIYVGGTAQTGSEMLWSRGGNQGNTNGLMVYSNFVITLATTATVEIRWRTSTGTATSTNRYLTLLKVSSIK